MGDWWNPASWDWEGARDKAAEWIWGLPFVGGDGFLGTATDTAVAAAINANVGGTGPLESVMGAFFDPVVPNYLYTPPAGLVAGGGFAANKPGENGYGWFPQGPVPDTWEEPLKQLGGLVLVGLAVAAAVALQD